MSDSQSKKRVYNDILSSLLSLSSDNKEPTTGNDTSSSKKQFLDKGQESSKYYGTFEKFINTLNNRSSGLSNMFIVEFLEFIKEEPTLALPMLLWIDTFHDFTRLRGKQGKEESDYDIASINNILDFYLYDKQGPWGKHEQGYAITYSGPYINDITELKHYCISKCFRDSFFDYSKDGTKIDLFKGVTIPKDKYKYDTIRFLFYPFHEDVEFTLLKTCYKWDQTNNEKYPEEDEKKYIYRDRCARILYQMSFLVYDEQNPFEPNLLYSYIMYNFFSHDSGFRSPEPGLSNYDISSKLSKTVITSITEENILPYYAKDVDTKKTSSVFEKSKLIILPASLFDQNKANSSNNPSNFVNINTTVIPFIGLHNFTYAYSNNNCLLTVSTSFHKNDNNLIADDINIYNSCKANSRDIFNDKYFENPNIINIKNLAKYINNDGDFDISKGQLNNSIQITDKKQLIEQINKFVENIKKDNKELSQYTQFIYKEGFSVKEISLRILCEIISKIKKGDLKLSRNNYTYNLLSATDFDKYMSLKRVGDFAQILQCKQLGIPLVTDDNMQILLSIASCSSVIWTPSDRILYYNGNSDCFVRYNKKNMCELTRHEGYFSSDGLYVTPEKTYKKVIDSLLLTEMNNSINDDDKEKLLKSVKGFTESFDKEVYKKRPTFLATSWFSEEMKKIKDKENQAILEKQKTAQKQQEDQQREEQEILEQTKKDIKIDSIIRTILKEKNYYTIKKGKTTVIDYINDKLKNEKLATIDQRYIKNNYPESDLQPKNLLSAFQSMNIKQTKVKYNKKSRGRKYKRYPKK